MASFVLMDIEGTTTSIDFVHRTLFPYASNHLPDFIHSHVDHPEVQGYLGDVRATILAEEGRSELSTQHCIDQLLHWIKTDRKHPALKALQGTIWKEGYEKGQYKGHLYEDVLPKWKLWKKQGKTLGIYSSGSVPAQKLLFGYSIAGDLNSYLSAYFDTKIGHKRDQQSYRNIAKAIKVPPSDVLFLSDVGAELDAAKAVGMQTIQLVRPGTQAVDNHPMANNFTEIEA